MTWSMELRQSTCFFIDQASLIAELEYRIEWWNETWIGTVNVQFKLI